jgi:hypothetical protein
MGNYVQAWEEQLTNVFFKNLLYKKNPSAYMEYTLNGAYLV